MPTQNSISTTGPGIVQAVSSYTNAQSAFTATMPGVSSAYLPGYFLSSDVIPQQTDGSEVLTVTITPRFSSSKLLIKYEGNACVDAGPPQFLSICSLFRDSGADALATTCCTDGYYQQHIIQYLDSASSTSPTTYKIRIGPNATGTININGKSGYGYFQPVFMCRLTVYEIKV